jgi:hypothetical protein
VVEKGSIIFCDFLQMGEGGFSPMFPANKAVGGYDAQITSLRSEKVMHSLVSTW